jgi:hypothetical protein
MGLGKGTRPQYPGSALTGVTGGGACGHFLYLVELCVKGVNNILKHDRFLFDKST